MRGYFRLAVQDGKWGYFGEVTVDVESTNAAELRLFFDCSESMWRAGAAFGLAYAYEKSFNGKGAVVHVTDIRGHDVDTTETVIAYVAANAFFDALKFERPAALVLDGSKGVFTFPK